jgi:hypothetical protein
LQWSVDSNGTVDGNRQIAQELSRVLPEFYTTADASANTTLTLDQTEFVFLHFYAHFQAMSLVNYHWYNDTSPPLPTNDPTHPLFQTWATLHVWAFGLSDKTSKMGVVIAIIGGIVVLFRTLLGVVTGIRDRSTVDLFIAALEHQNQGEFEGMQEQSHRAKVRYEMLEDASGKPMFVPEKPYLDSPGGGADVA